MSTFEEELQKDVLAFFKDKWTITDGQVVPKTEDLGLRNVGRYLSATVLYADIDESTSLVDNYRPWFAAAVYKAFLLCSTRIIRKNGGEVRSFDGDRVMGVFIGDSKNTDSARTALQINYAVSKVIRPTITSRYPDVKYVLSHTVGIDTSNMLVVRGGIRQQNNDLIWIGRAANYAAKLNSLTSIYPTRITSEVYDCLHESVLIGGNPKKNMWSKATWSGKYIYQSDWIWPP